MRLEQMQMQRFVTRGKAASLEVIDFGQYLAAKRAEPPRRTWPDLALTAALIVTGTVFLVVFTLTAPRVRLFLGLVGDACATLLGGAHG